MSVCCDWCVTSGRELYVGLITRPEESYKVWCVSVIVKPRNEEALARDELVRHGKKVLGFTVFIVPSNCVLISWLAT
jgi:hypothetical protein